MMQPHRFACGESVLYTEHRFPNLSWKEPFTIIDLLPSNGLEPLYRIRSMDRITDHLVSERALCSLPLRDISRRRLDGRSAELSASKGSQ